MISEYKKNQVAPMNQANPIADGLSEKTQLDFGATKTVDLMTGTGKQTKGEWDDDQIDSSRHLLDSQSATSRFSPNKSKKKAPKQSNNYLKESILRSPDKKCDFEGN